MCYTLNLPCRLMRQNQIKTDLLADFIEKSLKDLKLTQKLTRDLNDPESIKRELEILNAERFLELLR
jgi:hypothetical protein